MIENPSGFDSLVPERIRRLEPYRAGRTIDEVKREFGLDEVVKLASNENPLGPPASVVKAAGDALAEGHRYPDPAARKMRAQLAQRYNLDLDNIIVGAGSESILASIVRTFVKPGDEVLTAGQTFIGFPILCRVRGVEPTGVPLDDSYRFDLEAIAEAIGPKTKLIYLCNPNNPTGTIFTRAEFDRFIKRVPSHVLVVQDEAYFEYAASDPDYPNSMDYRYDNVITLRTFSKAYGLAGYRVGYGFGHPKLIAALWKVKLPFEPSGPAQAAAQAVLSDEAYLERSLAVNEQGKGYLFKELSRLGIAVIKTHANFMMMKFDSSEQVDFYFLELQKRGVITRPLRQSGLPDCLRVSIGLPEENERFIEALEEIRESS